MCKFGSENAPGYRTVSTALREWVADAPNVIPLRWRDEDKRRLAKANLEFTERLQHLHGSGAASASDPQLIGTLLIPAGNGWYRAWSPQGQVLRVVEVEQESYPIAAEDGNIPLFRDTR
ncbi:hypothetical protein VTI74DRAFT_7684 [Chaetomium olivicolor]